MSYCERHGVRWTGWRAEHCESCGEVFSGSTAGDKHRVGDHAVFTGPTRRRCLTADEMLAKGMTYLTNAHGTWIWGTGRSRDPLTYSKSLSQDGPGLRTGTPEGDSLALKNEAVTEMEAS